MKLPKDWKLYRDFVKNKVDILCKSKLWPVRATEVYSWLNNFQQEEHKYLSIHIIDSIIYRSKYMTSASYQRFISSTLKQKVEVHVNSGLIEFPEWNRMLLNKHSTIRDNLFLSPVKLNGDAGDSGEIIVRILTSDIMGQHLQKVLNKDIWSTLQNRIILLVDDFLGTGDQFTDFYEEVNLKEGAKKNKIIFAPSLARVKAISDISAKYPDIEICPVEILHDDESIFYGEQNDMFRHDNLNTVADALNCYEDICKKHKMVRSMWHGYKDLSLSVVFESGCPNHTLGLLYHRNNSNSWSQLFRRRQ